MYFVGHDLGTSGNKAVLVDAEGNVRASAVGSYPLHRPRPGWAEQSPDEWWSAVVETTRSVVARADVDPKDIAGLGFAGQMLALVALDGEGRPTRPAVSWLDARAEEQARRITRRFGGERILHLLAGASPTGKDLVAKLAWIEQHEPEVFRRTQAFTDATGYLVARSTGELVIDPTAAGCTGMLDTESRSWNRLLSRLISFPLSKMPRLVASTDVAGPLGARAASELGLRRGTPVVMGMADIPAAAVGSGAVLPGQGHVYLGTSSWIGIRTEGAKNAPKTGIASVPSADRRGHLLIGESETAGACRDWLTQRMNLGDDELESGVLGTPPGADGLLFLPWMYGERSPVPDAALRGGFVGLSLEHERAHLGRALYEGIALNLRWILEECALLGEACPTLRAIGGGTRSEAWSQILADVLERPIERVAEPRLAGAIGAALVAAVGTGALDSVAAIGPRVRVDRVFLPRREHREVYARSYAAFRSLQPALSRSAGWLAKGGHGRDGH